MKRRPKEIILTFGLSNTVTVRVDQELTIGKLLSYRQIQELLGYDYHNVVAVLDGTYVDFETFVGANDVEIDLEVRQNIKAAKPKALIRKLGVLVDLKLKRRGTKHDIYITTTGTHISIPRHARDIAPGTLRSIAREIRPGVGLSEFKKFLSQ